MCVCVCRQAGLDDSVTVQALAGGLWSSCYAFGCDTIIRTHSIETTFVKLNMIVDAERGKC